MEVTHLWIANFAGDFTSTDWMVYAFLCVLAVSVGVVLAKKQAQKFSGQGHGTHNMPSNHNDGHPVVTFFDYGDMRFLHLGTPAVQGSMQISKPFDIHLEYQQRMMGWLLFTDLEHLSRLHVMQMGLGAASLTKFCHHHLRVRTTAVELNPHVVTTCQQWFKLATHAEKLQVVLADAAQVARDPQWQGAIDVLQVDLYDPEAACPVIDTEAFYADCQKMLTPNGCMVVNVFGRASNLKHSLAKMATSFGKEGLWTFKPTSAGNAIVLAFRTPHLNDKKALLTQARLIENRWPLPATQWLKVLAPSHTPHAIQASSRMA